MNNGIIKKQAFVSIFAIFFSAIVVSVLTAIYVLLIKQIEMMQIDSQSFQSLYVADSAFECMVLKEQTATYTRSVFLPANAGSLGNCVNAGDLSWVTSPTSQTPVGQSIRAKSVANFSITTNEGDFCAIINTDVETADSSQWTVAPGPNFMTIAGHNKACGSPSQKVVERVIDFYF
jgi:hypothetical protein